MKKPPRLLLTVMLGLLLATCAAISPVSAQHDYNAFSGSTIDDNTIDGTIGSEWDDAGNYANSAISPQGTAEVWTKHDGTYLYMAARFTADSNNPWVAFLFGESGCMPADTDGALFGHDSYAADGYRDIWFGGVGIISIDASQDGMGAMSVSSSNLVTVELKKPLSSGDSAGKDLAWIEDNAYGLIIMWDSNGGGSSGGSVGHSRGLITMRTVFVDSNVIPEFPSLMFCAVLVATAFSAVLLKKRIIKMPLANG